MEISNEEIYLAGANICAFIFSIVYMISHTVGEVALKYAEELNSPDESGIFILGTFSRMFFIVAVFGIILLDIKYIYDDYIKHRDDL